MRTYSSLFLLAALGALPAAAAEVDTSQWKCESCPYPKGASGSVTAGIGGVDEASNAFGNFTGLDRKGAHAVLGGSVLYRGADGYFADVTAADLGIDTRSLAATSGREGLYSLRLGYSELPRLFGDGAMTPFIGTGGATLTLPAGFPAATTAAMPLATTLHDVDIGYRHKRYELGGTLIGSEHWTYKVSLRRDTRDGTQPGAGSFFSTSSQLVVPLDQTTDRLEVSAAYATRGLQATLGYQLSQFKNGNPALNWTNPFPAVIAGATEGQLALAPDNQFQQVLASAGYDVMPGVRASANVAVGRLTQNQAFLQPTLNAAILPTLSPLAAPSLDGRVETFNGSARVTAALIEGLRLTASYARDVRQNKTAVNSYPLVDTDMFVDTPRSNTPYTFKQDRLRLSGDYRIDAAWRVAGGLDEDWVQRSYSEVVRTREGTVWGRVAAQPREDLNLSLKLAHAERVHTTYGVAQWFGSPENPLLRRLNLGDRRRDSATLRGDFTVNEQVSLGLSLDHADDTYPDTAIGLTSARHFGIALDLAASIGEQTQITAYVQADRVRSRMAGSSQFSQADWNATDKDHTEVFGATVKHAAIPGKLDIGADLSFVRSRNDTLVQATISDPAFPSVTSARDTAKLFASYKWSEQIWLDGSLWHERYRAEDWRLAGIGPATLPDLLAFGWQPPHYDIVAARVAVRYRF